MMMRLAVFILAALATVGADDPWAKVKELGSGSELKIWKKGAAQPVEAVYDDLTEEKLLAVVKNEQVAIPKAEIDRIDARAKAQKGKAVKETRVERDVHRPERAAAPPRSMREPTAGSPQSTVSNTVSWANGKAPYETVYRRTARAEAK
ncbi:MAG: hypothetical protein IH602_11870 [Bryobacteraceae bacterium]|nr:hypothetical protein [Bryobacteraceae bacterium]